ncbi:MAG: mechanosensitive ion channel [Brumimicrobium sp.]|nr:mechanosensitive ion channel [Brumimicrobium sp.]
MTFLVLNFTVGPYEASLWTVIVWIAVVVFTIILHKLIQKYLKRHLKKRKLKIKGTRITLFRVLNQLLYLTAAIVAFQAFRIDNDEISLREFLKHDIIPEITEGGFSLSFMDLITIVIIFAISRFAINVFRIFMDQRFKDSEDFDEGSRFVYVQLAKYIVYTFAIIISLQFLFENLSVIIAGSAAFFVSLGLGLQGIFKDMVSGVVLLFEGTIKVGDIIRVPNPITEHEVVARVLKINVRTTKIETRDGNTLIIPNSILTQEQIENWSFGSNLTRFIINVGVAYGSDTELVKDLMKQAALSHPEVKKTEPVIVRMINFGDNALEMQLLFWADQSWQVELHKSDIRFEIDRLFRQHGVTIPFPQRTLHVPENMYVVNGPKGDNQVSRKD